MNKLIPRLVLAASAGLVGVASAEAPSGVYIPFGVMVYDYDDSTRRLDTDGLPTLGIGYRFDDRLAVELMAADSSTDINVAGAGDADVRHYRVDGLYFLDNVSGLTPYVVGGLGENRIDYDALGTTEDTLLNGGVGLLFQATEHFAVRGDVRAIYSLDNANTEAAVNLLAQFSFGGSSKPAPQAAPAPAPVAAAAPVAVASAPVDNDTDKDGVPNKIDRCPKTPAGKTVDKNGCDCDYTLKLNFGFDSAVLSAEDKAELDVLRAAIQDLGYTRADVAGYTDSRGAEAYNQQLSLRRAQAVVDYLASKGVNADKLHAVGYGEAQPVADNSTEAGRAENRRVVIERTDCAAQ